jgi:hypothetical protein
LQDELNALGSSPDATGIPKPEPIILDLPLLPGPPSWRTGFRDAADDLVGQAIEDAHAALDANARATGPRIAMMQVLDHHLARGEPLPSRTLELLRRVLRLDRRSITAAKRRARIRQGEESPVALAAEWGITRQAVEQLRDEPAQESDALVTYLAVEHAAEQTQPPRRSTRDAVARLLGLLNSNGKWRRKVVQTLYAGLQQPERVHDAALAEAKRRADGRAKNNADAVAEDIGLDARTVERWMTRSEWEMAMLGQAVGLRGGLRPKPRKPRAD